MRLGDYNTQKMWFGELPDGWTACRLKHVCELIGSGTTPQSGNALFYDGDINWIQSGDLYNKNVIQYTEKHITNAATRECSALHIYRAPFIVVAMYGASIGNVAISTIDACVNQACCVLKPSQHCDLMFAYYALSACRSDLLRQAVGGTQPNISQQKMREETIPLPPLPIQRQIVDFLDEKIAAMERLAEIRNNQFTLLQELVARQFRDVSATSVKKVRLKHCVQLLQDFIILDGNATYTKTGMYNRGRGIFRRDPMLGKDMGDSMFQEIHAGCVMISGQFAWEAAAYITTPEDEAGVASHRYYLLQPSGKLSAEYIWCFLMSDYGQELMKQCSHGAAGRNRPLNIRELLNEYIPIPSDDRDLADLARNVHVLMDFRKLIAKEEAELGALKSRIIADAVTGAVEVP